MVRKRYSPVEPVVNWPYPWKFLSIPVGVVSGVVINLFRVALPDLDQSIPHRAARRVEHLAGQVGDLADGRSDAVVDDDQVVVGVERQLVGIKWPFFTLRCPRELIGEKPGRGEQRRAERAQEDAPAGNEKFVSAWERLPSENGVVFVRRRNILKRSTLDLLVNRRPCGRQRNRRRLIVPQIVRRLNPVTQVKQHPETGDSTETRKVDPILAPKLMSKDPA